jgi:leucyl aminopeptidase
MSAEIEVALTSRPLERAEAEIAVAGFFVDERPLRGGAARADWRLCGGLSKRIESGDLSGKSGEALLIGSGRALAAPRLMLLGLGDRKAFDQVRVTDEIRSALDRCLKLGLSQIALSPLGIAPDDIPRHAPALVAGILDAWQGSPRPMTLRLCAPAGEIPAVLRAFDDARHAANTVDFTVSIPEAGPASR